MNDNSIFSGVIEAQDWRAITTDFATVTNACWHIYILDEEGLAYIHSLILWAPLDINVDAMADLIARERDDCYDYDDSDDDGY